MAVFWLYEAGPKPHCGAPVSVSHHQPASERANNKGNRTYIHGGDGHLQSEPNAQPSPGITGACRRNMDYRFAKLSRKLCRWPNTKWSDLHREYECHIVEHEHDGCKTRLDRRLVLAFYVGSRHEVTLSS